VGTGKESLAITHLVNHWKPKGGTIQTLQLGDLRHQEDLFQVGGQLEDQLQLEEQLLQEEQQLPEEQLPLEEPLQQEELQGEQQGGQQGEQQGGQHQHRGP